VSDEQLTAEMVEKMEAGARAIPGYPRYYASPSGHIYSTVYGSPRRLSAFQTRQGYLQVNLSCVRHYVHAVVCLTFHGQRPGDNFQVRHLNGCRTDNAASNLAWGTPKEDASDRIKHGRIPRGTKNRQSKLTLGQIPEIRRLISAGVPLRRIALSFGVTWTAIQNIRVGKAWRYA
jgi:hypothetical protein